MTQSQSANSPSKKLADFRPGEKGRILRIESQDLQLALLSYGVIPGELFMFSETAPLGGPVSIRIEGTKVALRRFHAEQIFAEVVE